MTMVPVKEGTSEGGKAHFQTEIEVDESWVQSRYQHVHHGRCLSLLEQGRLRLLEAIGFPHEVLLDSGLGLVITRIDISYRREIKQGRIIVTCEEPRINGRSIVLKQRVINERGKEAARATVESMFMDLASRRGLEVPVNFRQAFESWQVNRSLS